MAVVNRPIARARAKEGPSLRLGPILLIAGGAIVIISLLQVVQSSEATTASFGIQRLEQRRLELETSVQEAEADVAELSSLERIEREAQRLGLTQPAARQTAEVNVAPPSAEDWLPSRFAPAGQDEPTDNGGSGGPAWWESLLDHLPFR